MTAATSDYVLFSNHRIFTHVLHIAIALIVISQAIKNYCLNKINSFRKIHVFASVNYNSGAKKDELQKLYHNIHGMLDW